MQPWLRGALLTGVYAILAGGSLQVATVHVSSSPVWPPSGLAIGVLTLWGRRFWPAIFVGAFAANAATTGHWESSLAIAVGNTLEGLAGASILGRFRDRAWRGVGFVMALVAAAMGAAAISAAFGVGALRWFDLAPDAALVAIAQTWWLGNVAGTLIVTPLLLTYRHVGAQDLLLLVSGVAAGALAFATTGLGLFLLIPVIFWGVRRHDGSSVAIAVLGIAIGAIAMTLTGRGPFWSNDALLLTQTFLVFLTVSGLIIAVERDLRHTRTAPVASLAATALTLAPLLIGGALLGATLQPALEELHESRQSVLQVGVTDAWASLVDAQGTQLRDLQAFFEAAEVNTTSFNQFVKSTGWEFGPGQVTAIGYAPLVAHDDVAAFEATVRSDVALPRPVRENFSVFPPVEAPEHAPVRYVYPLDPQPGAIGFDLYVDEIRSASLRNSRILDEPVASAPVEIVRPEGNDLGVMVAMPVERDGRVVGFVISAIALPDAASAPQAPAGIDYRVVDVTANESVLFSTGNETWNGATDLQAWGRDWRIDFAIPPQSTPTERAAPWFIIVVAGVLSCAVGIVVYAYDTSRNKAVLLGGQMAEQARQEEQRVAEMRRLKELDAFRLRFLNMASHELRTPLTPIIAQTQILRVLSSDERLNGPLETLERGAKRLNTIVDDLLLAAKAEAEELPMDMQPLDLAEVARRAVEAHQETATGRDVVLTFAGDATPVVGDADRIAQILDNLLTNAIKFAPGGTVSVTVTDEGGPAVVVADTGQGIAPDQLPLIGEPFMQAAGVDGGTGLGVFICKTLAQLLGGSLEIASDGLGKGTEVTLRLPPAPETDS